MNRLLPCALALFCAPVLIVAAQPVRSAAAQAIPATTTADADLDVVRDRFVRSVLPVGDAAIEAVRARSAVYAAALGADWSWDDIKYTDDARSVWANTPLGKVEADHSCLLLVRQVEGRWKVTASNPDSLPLTLHVTVKGKLATIELPGGNFAGSSVSADVR